MNQTEEWLRIAARIKGFGKAAEAFWRGVGSTGHSSGAATGWIVQSAEEIIVLLGEFKTSRATSLSISARDALDSGLSKLESLKKDGSGYPKAAALCTGLLALECELTYYLTDLDSTARPVIERALLHLQRLLVVDSGLRNRWEVAYEGGGETSCEQLGAVHLLHHGIYAFKANARGERTDLVLGDKLTVNTDMQRGTSALVLTEWKLVKEAAEVERKVAKAIQQAKLYSKGSLLGFEVQSFRYIVVVSKNRVALPADTMENDVLYRNVNIAIKPAVPSKEVVH